MSWCSLGFHEWSEWMVMRAPTWFYPGAQMRQCKKCKKTGAASI